MIIRLTRRYGFPASHRLHSTALTDEQNRATYGKCNNPFGHGHDYEVELTIRGQVNPGTGKVVDVAELDRLAEEQILVPFRFKYLNQQVPAFENKVPTTENLAIEVDRRLRLVWTSAFPLGEPCLENVRIRETDRNICDLGAK